MDKDGAVGSSRRLIVFLLMEIDTSTRSKKRRRPKSGILFCQVLCLARVIVSPFDKKKKNRKELSHTILLPLINTTGFNAELQVTAQDLDFNDQDAYLQHRTPLEIYGFLIYWIISITEQKATSKAATMDKSGKATVLFSSIFTR